MYKEQEEGHLEKEEEGKDKKEREKKRNTSRKRAIDEELNNEHKIELRELKENASWGGERGSVVKGKGKTLVRIEEVKAKKMSSSKIICLMLKR